MKKYIIYAGVNGAGKSTLYQTNHVQADLARINTDEILKEFGDWRNSEGYMIEMHYVGIDSSETAKKRIAERVKMGGHGIPDRYVEKRYEESLINLGKVLPLYDLAAIYDNTSRFRRFAIFKKGNLIVLSKQSPAWYQKVQIE